MHQQFCLVPLGVPVDGFTAITHCPDTYTLHKNVNKMVLDSQNTRVKHSDGSLVADSTSGGNALEETVLTCKVADAFVREGGDGPGKRAR
jgi:hypothetical protein